MLTYTQVSQRAWRASVFSAAIGFVVVSAWRLQLAAGLTTPRAYDIAVWVVIGSVTVTVLAGAGFYVWIRVWDYVVTHRHQLVPTLVWMPDEDAEPVTEPLPVPPVTEPLPVQPTVGRHRQRGAR